MTNRLDDIERRLKRLEDTLFPPERPVGPPQIYARCGVCERDLQRSGAYVCTRGNCPTLRAGLWAGA